MSPMAKMNKQATLSLAFIERQPVSAARTLATMPPGDAAAFLNGIPTRFGAVVVAQIGSWQSALILAQMEPAAAAALLDALAYQDAAAILRLVPSDRLADILESLPKKLRDDFKSSLSFPADTVGAQMTPAIIALAPSRSVADALSLFRRLPPSDMDQIFVVANDHRPVGIVTIADLVRPREDVALQEIMRPIVATLSARARLHAVGDLPAWDVFTYLPVLSRRKHLIGALSRKALKRSARNALTRGPADNESIAGSMIDEFIAVSLGLARLLADAEAVGPRTTRQRK